MKTKSILALSILTFAPIALCQESDNTGYFYLHYMTVDSADAGDHTATEQEYVSQIHEERIARGYVEGWNMWVIMNPLDRDGSKRTFLFVHHYASLEQMESQDYGIYDSFKFKGMSQSESEQLMSEHFDRITNNWSLIVVGLDRWGDIDQADSVYSRLNYMKVDWRRSKDYVDMERNVFKKRGQEGGSRIGWGLGKVLNYFGSEFPFNFVTVDHFDSYPKLLKTRERIGNYRDLDADTREFFGYRTLANSHILSLVTSVKK